MNAEPTVLLKLKLSMHGGRGSRVTEPRHLRKSHSKPPKVRRLRKPARVEKKSLKVHGA